ncbi:MAG: hypothetical protein A2Z70_02660 [Chloroflexi bacterium RBG_13_48_17]|nr:MAG: hypothetical protein A2Z70_02660 [Chloroflexi bacterium RBG_13_48_17]
MANISKVVPPVTISQHTTIVVTWTPKQPKPFSQINPFYCTFANVEVVPGMNVRIKGADFNPGETVSLDICGKWKLGTAKANECRAFQVIVPIPNDPALYALQVVSVKALVNHVCVASWPLDIVKELPKPPKG